MRQKWNINLKMSQSKCSTGGVRGLINHSMACGACCDACKMSNPRNFLLCKYNSWQNPQKQEFTRRKNESNQELEFFKYALKLGCSNCVNLHSQQSNAYN